MDFFLYITQANMNVILEINFNNYTMYTFYIFVILLLIVILSSFAEQKGKGNMRISL